MYYKSVENFFHAALWSCRENSTCYLDVVNHQSRKKILHGPNNDARKMYVLPLMRLFPDTCVIRNCEIEMCNATFIVETVESALRCNERSLDRKIICP